jgi:hypothetical protein
MKTAPFSFSYPAGAAVDEIARLRDQAARVASVRATNRAAQWHLNDCEESPGPIVAIRLRDGRFLECEDGPEVFGLSWVKCGEPDDVVEYLADELP